MSAPKLPTTIAVESYVQSLVDKWKDNKLHGRELTSMIVGPIESDNDQRFEKANQKVLGKV